MPKKKVFKKPQISDKTLLIEDCGTIPMDSIASEYSLMNCTMDFAYTVSSAVAVLTRFAYRASSSFIDEIPHKVATFFSGYTVSEEFQNGTRNSVTYSRR